MNSLILISFEASPIAIKPVTKITFATMTRQQLVEQICQKAILSLCWFRY